MKLMKLQDAKDTYYNLNSFIKMLGSVVFDTVSVRDEDYNGDENDTPVTVITVFDASGYPVLNVRCYKYECYLAQTEDLMKIFMTNDYGKVVEL